MEAKSNNRRQPWPYAAKEARDKSAEDAAVIVTVLDPILEAHQMSAEQIIRAVAKARIKASDIRARLAQQGAQVVI